ncbi:carboxypeptidase-like regulatory domain-containing protein [Dyadobacter sp. 676]|uniref:Carboxypeptidase-like regulatory domain-containing protein n=1 Tax=Dyadobacter sp. 676 TaxID=3088362 RepID=A0AAU8FRL2_9BACT
MRFSTGWTPRAVSRSVFSLCLALMTVMGAFAQNSIKGKIKDEQGQPLPGVSVVVKGTTAGTVTDNEGLYTVNAEKNGTLVFSFIGYLTQEVPVAGKSIIDVILIADTKALEEVVVVGYGTAKKATLTGSVTAVKGTELPEGTCCQLIQHAGWTFAGYFGRTIQW